MKLEGNKLGISQGWISVVLNTILFVMKFWIGTKLNSVSMVADSWHTLSDTLTSVIVIVGFWITAKPADEKHPFGHARAENIAAIIIAVLLAIVGVGFFKESVQRLISHQTATFSILGIVIFLISALLKEALARYAFWVGKKIDSQSVSADGWHHRSDAIASILIVVGAIFSKSLWWMDGALGIGVSLLILYAAFDIFKETSSVLLGESPDQEKNKEMIEEIYKCCPTVKDVHHLHLHKYGNKTELTVHIRLASDMKVSESHEISDCVENLIKTKYGHESTIHIEPFIEELAKKK